MQSMEVMEVHNGPATPPVMRTKWHGRWVGVKCVTTMKMPNATLKSWLYRNDGIRTSFYCWYRYFCHLLHLAFCLHRWIPGNESDEDKRQGEANDKSEDTNDKKRF